MTLATACADLGFDPTQPVASDSAALFVATDDATAAVSIRVCRYPAADRTWLWVHVFSPDGTYGYNEDHLLFDRPARFDRAGASVDVDVSVAAHAGSRAYDAPDAPGDTAVRITGQFRRNAGAGATLPGRTEELGDASVTVAVEGRPDFTVAGLAHFHEQTQDAPRFVVPFTYASLRGPDLSLVALVGPRKSGGFARGPGGDHALSAATFGDAVDGRHSLELVGESGLIMRGDATVAHAYTIPIYGQAWSGSIVTATLEGHDLSGSVNRWRPSL